MQGSSRGSDSMTSSKVGDPHATPSPRERAPLIGREPGAGVETLQLGHRPEGDRSAAVGRPVERLVVNHDERAIACHTQIELDGIDTERHGLAQRLERVLRRVGAIAAMADDRSGMRIEQDHGSGRRMAGLPGVLAAIRHLSGGGVPQQLSAVKSDLAPDWHGSVQRPTRPYWSSGPGSCDRWMRRSSDRRGRRCRHWPARCAARPPWPSDRARASLTPGRPSAPRGWNAIRPSSHTCAGANLRCRARHSASSACNWFLSCCAAPLLSVSASLATTPPVPGMPVTRGVCRRLVDGCPSNRST